MKITINITIGGSHAIPNSAENVIPKDRLWISLSNFNYCYKLLPFANLAPQKLFKGHYSATKDSVMC